MTNATAPRMSPEQVTDRINAILKPAVDARMAGTGETEREAFGHIFGQFQANYPDQAAFLTRRAVAVWAAS